MSGRWNDDSLNCDFKSVHCKLDQFEKALQSVTDDVSEDILGEKVGMIVENSMLRPKGRAYSHIGIVMGVLITSVLYVAL